MAAKKNDTDLWKEIEEEFSNCENVVEGWLLPTEYEVRKYRAALKTKGELVQATLDGEYEGKSGRVVFKLPPVSDTALFEMYSAFKILGIELPNEAEAKFPNHLVNPDTKKVREIIRNALTKQRLSLEFLKAWGEYKQAFVRFDALLNGKESNDYYKANILNNLPNVIERHIYAYAMNRDWLSGNMTRPQAEDVLQKAIVKILAYPGKKETQELKALRNMQSEGEHILKETYRRMDPEEILQIVEEQMIPLSSLKIFSS